MIKHAQRKQYVQRPAIDVQLEKYQQLALEQRNSFVTAKKPSHREGRAPTPGADSEDKLAPQAEHVLTVQDLPAPESEVAESHMYIKQSSAAYSGYTSHGLLNVHRYNHRIDDYKMEPTREEWQQLQRRQDRYLGHEPASSLHAFMSLDKEVTESLS